MESGKRFGFSVVEKNKIWGRWKAGQSLHEIGRAFDKPHSSIRCLLLPRGGIPPVARRRSRRSLNLAEREDISRGIASGSSIREIARRLDRAASTLSREISRNGGRPTYRAHTADDHAWDSALRPKKCLLAVSRKLRNIVASKLILDWSPEQIAGWLKIQFPDDASCECPTRRFTAAFSFKSASAEFSFFYTKRSSSDLYIQTYRDLLRAKALGMLIGPDPSMFLTWAFFASRTEMFVRPSILKAVHEDS
jgi:transposase-like protein